MLSCSSLIDLAWQFWRNKREKHPPCNKGRRCSQNRMSVSSKHLYHKAHLQSATKHKNMDKTWATSVKNSRAWNLDSAQSLMRTFGRTYGQIFTKSNAETTRDLEEMWKKKTENLKKKKNRKSRKSRKSEEKWWRFESGRSAKLVAGALTWTTWPRRCG